MAVSRKTNDVPRGISSERIVQFANEIDRLKSKLDDASMDHAGVYKRAEAAGANKKALKLATQLRNMEPAKRQDYLASLDFYCRALGVFAQGDLFSDAEQGVPQGDEIDPIIRAKAPVRQSRKAAKTVAPVKMSQCSSGPRSTPEEAGASCPDATAPSVMRCILPVYANERSLELAC